LRNLRSTLKAISTVLAEVVALRRQTAKNISASSPETVNSLRQVAKLVSTAWAEVVDSFAGVAHIIRLTQANVLVYRRLEGVRTCNQRGASRDCQAGSSDSKLIGASNSETVNYDVGVSKNLSFSMAESSQSCGFCRKNCPRHYGGNHCEYPIKNASETRFHSRSAGSIPAAFHRSFGKRRTGSSGEHPALYRPRGECRASPIDNISALDWPCRRGNSDASRKSIPLYWPRREKFPAADHHFASVDWSRDHCHYDELTVFGVKYNSSLQ
jgi:hypothetical protein